MCALLLYPATPSWGVRCGCVCLGSGLGCAPPLLAGPLGCSYVCVRFLSVPRHSWLGYAVWVCVLGSGLGCAPPLLAVVFGSVCFCSRAPPVPRQSWLWRAMWVCVLGPRFRLRFATPGFHFGVSVYLCAHSSCTPPIRAAVCGVDVEAGKCGLHSNALLRCNDERAINYTNQTHIYLALGFCAVLQSIPNPLLKAFKHVVFATHAFACAKKASTCIPCLVHLCLFLPLRNLPPQNASKTILPLPLRMQKL